MNCRENGLIAPCSHDDCQDSGGFEITILEFLVSPWGGTTDEMTRDAPSPPALSLREGP